LIDAQAAYAAALAPLSKSEIQELRMYLYPVMVSQNSVGHTLADRGPAAASATWSRRWTAGR